MNSNKGFSLIELMIVVAIIGMLSLIAVPMYKDYVIRVRVLEAISEVEFVKQRLITAYMVDGDEGIKEGIKNLCNDFQCSSYNAGFNTAYVVINGNSADNVTVSYTQSIGPFFPGKVTLNIF